ncbi:MAG: beta-lactamase family protein [Planctomycetaceae bacterium]|nr:beta-lactamase family protein [Planctomycetaceae bacterium]
MKRYVITVCLLLLTSAAFAQTPEMPARVDELAAEYFGEGKPVVGGVIGIVDGNKRYAKGYGRVSLDSEASPDIDTVYEIASLSKTFTGVLLGEMVARNEISLDEPLDQFVPQGISVPRYDGETVTLRQLSTHSSGLPRLPTDFWQVAAPEPDNPYKFYTSEKIERFLDTYQLTVKPDSRYEYSNLGASVLGYAMEQKTGKTYEQLVQERICQPLGMANTAVELTESMREKLAPPYDEKHQPANNWDLPGFAAGGGLRSSMRDMLAFAQAAAGVLEAFPGLAANPDHPLVAGMKAAGSLHYEDTASNRRMGLGWHFNPSGDLTHNGQTGGYHSDIIANPKSRRAIVLLTNTAASDADRLSETLWKSFDWK